MPLTTGHSGATHSYFGATTDSFIFDGGSGTASLRPDFTASIHRFHIEITDTGQGNYLTGDDAANEVGNDSSQDAVVRSPDGTFVTSGQVYAEQAHTISAPDGTLIQVYEIEIAGRLVGYLTSEPILPGVTYNIVGTADVTSSNQAEYTKLDSVPCFGPGTLISTTDGDLPIEWLCPGDRVITRDQGAQPLRWIGQYQLSAQQLAGDPTLRPVQIGADRFGPGAPSHPLTLSPQHRVFVSGPEIQYFFGQECAFATAKHLADQSDVQKNGAGITYYHLLFDRHHVIRSNGLWTESLFANRAQNHVGRASGTLPPPDIQHDKTAYPCLAGWEAKLLREMRWPKPLVMPQYTAKAA